MRGLIAITLLALAACGTPTPDEPECPFGPGEYELQRTVVWDTCTPYIGPITPLSRVQQTMADGALEGCDGIALEVSEGCGLIVKADCADGSFEGTYAWVSESEYEGFVTYETPRLQCRTEIRIDAVLFSEKP